MHNCRKSERLLRFLVQSFLFADCFGHGPCFDKVVDVMEVALVKENHLFNCFGNHVSFHPLQCRSLCGHKEMHHVHLFQGQQLYFLVDAARVPDQAAVSANHTVARDNA